MRIPVLGETLIGELSEFSAQGFKVMMNTVF